jgi:hypothetical protein
MEFTKAIRCTCGHHHIGSNGREEFVCPQYPEGCNCIEFKSTMRTTIPRPPRYLRCRACGLTGWSNAEPFAAHQTECMSGWIELPEEY